MNKASDSFDCWSFFIIKSLNKKTKPPANRQKCHKMSGLKGKTSIYA